MTRRVSIVCLLVPAALVVATHAATHAASPVVTLDGTWTGTFAGRRAHGSAVAAAALTQSGASVGGTLTLAGGDASGTIAVTGEVHRMRALLAGKVGSRKVRWKAHWAAKRQSWRGPLVMRDGGRRMHGMLGFGRGTEGPAAECGAAFFASDVMSTVIERTCVQCHVAGGLAQNARLRVVAGDPVATALSAIGLVDMGDPLHSPLLLKPRADVAHGGGRRIEPGSVEEQVLQHWIALVTSPSCGGGPTGDPYVDNCTSCHGADARGGPGYPDIHCSRSIRDVVRAGRTGGAIEMPAFPGLSDQDIATIQTFLTGLCPTTEATGAELYGGNCASCHGTDARGVNGQPNIRCNRSIYDPVRNGRTGGAATMPAFPTMADAEITLVQGYLVGLCPAGTATGSDLYAGNCLTCHGPDAGGTVDAPSVRCATRVSDALALGRGTRMPSFPGIAGADLTSLTGFLAQTCVQYGRTAADLYAGNCASCHGADAGGGRSGLGVRGPEIQCTGANDYREKVRSGDDEMPAFPALSTSDADAIASFVRGAYCPGG